MSAAMASRGPDDERIFTDYFPGVSLGARRLSVIDLKGGRQPVPNEDGAAWAALSGEIYNHAALREPLRHRGHRFSTGVDTEVLVHLYEEYGGSMVHLVEGMYAFSLWDARREELLLVRDRFGEKPLFYTEEHGELLFASELDALLAGMTREPELDPASVDAFFVLGYVPGPESIFRGVNQLPPAHVLRWDRRSRRPMSSRTGVPRRPGRATPARPSTSSWPRPAACWIAPYGTAWSRMSPLGVLLGAGLDSTLVPALAARASGGPIKTFTVGHGSGGAGETVRARRTAQELGTEHHELVLTEDELLGRVPDLLGGMDQPLADPALVLLHAVAEHARREVTVAIGDEGADELFGGHSRYRWLWRSEPDCVKTRRPALRGRLYGPALRGGVREAGFVGYTAARVNGAVDDPAIRQLMAVDRQHCLPDDALARADRASMRVSLEVRTPYLSPALVEFAATVSPSVHVRDGGKALLRGLLAELAPKAAARCSTTASPTPASEWLGGPLAPLVDHQLEHGSAFAEGWVDRHEAAQLVSDHRAGIQDASAVIWPLLAFGMWLDRKRERNPT
jgi:asparagine synthase (glutamine-hydrolysing)